MTAKKGQGTRWCQVTVVLREDILAQAQASGVDISDLCNRAVADATGIRYVPPKPADAAPAAPVIVAGNGAPPGGDAIPSIVPPPGIHPVINADDPRSATTVKQVPRPSLPTVPATLPGRVSSPEKPAKAPAAPLPSPRGEKPGKAQARPEKKGTGSSIKKFVAGAIVREDTDEGHITKDLLYQAFARWCREHRITPVPDRRAFTVALKNQFAMKEKTVDGEPSWVNVRLR